MPSFSDEFFYDSYCNQASTLQYPTDSDIVNKFRYDTVTQYHSSTLKLSSLCIDDFYTDLMKILFDSIYLWIYEIGVVDDYTLPIEFTVFASDIDRGIRYSLDIPTFVFEYIILNKTPS